MSSVPSVLYLKSLMIGLGAVGSKNLAVIFPAFCVAQVSAVASTSTANLEV